MSIFLTQNLTNSLHGVLWTTHQDPTPGSRDLGGKRGSPVGSYPAPKMCDSLVQRDQRVLFLQTEQECPHPW